MNDWIAVLRAADLAAKWHVDQRRKGVAKEPYVNHLLEVASLVAEATPHLRNQFRSEAAGDFECARLVRHDDSDDRCRSTVLQ